MTGREPDNMTLDAIALEVLWQRLVVIADEVASDIVRTSFSNIVKDNKDFGCMVLDAEGRTIAQSSLSVPSYVGLASRAFEFVRSAGVLEELSQGDVFLTNDAWGVAGHLNDALVLVPSFEGGRVIGYIAAISHLPDIGGAISATAKEVYAEGLCLPPLKFMIAGQEDPTVRSIIESNVRVSGLVLGDLRALATSLSRGAEKLAQVARDFRLDGLGALSDEIRRRSAAVMRQRIIEMLPDGTYTGSVTVEGYDRPIRLAASILVRDGSVVVDYSGSDDQVEFPINCVANYTYAYTVYALKCVLDPETPNNDGCFVPFSVAATEGSVLNCTYPAAVWARHLVGHYLPFLVFNALAQAVPDRVMAESAAPSWAAYMRGQHQGSHFAHVAFFNGGMGARKGFDGIACYAYPHNTGNEPVELFENAVPIRVEAKQLITDSCGAGEVRGGLGQELRYRVLADAGLRLVIRHERVENGPAGVLGGQPGAPGENLVDGIPIPSKGETLVPGGSVITFRTPGGGGYGDPSLRPTSKVLEDVAEGYVSVAAARDIYGVDIPGSSVGGDDGTRAEGIPS